MTRSVRPALVAIGVLLWAAAQAAAQPAPHTPEERAQRLAEPDYTLVSLPTSLRVPAHRSAVRITHRFADTIDGAGAEGLFGIDSGAQVGFEYRFGITGRVDVGIHRTSNRVIELFGKYGLARQGMGMPVEIAAFASVEGTDNFGLSGEVPSSHTAAVSVIVTRMTGDWAAFHVEPAWVHHANLFEPAIEDRDTFMVGLGGRARVRPTVYVVGEWVPRVAGYDSHRDHASIAIEKRAGGHVFQLNLSDSVATTMGQIARGDVGAAGWHLGFNITRRF